jgi:hypothetical protein
MSPLPHLAWSPRSGHLPGAQDRDLFDDVDANLVDHGLQHVAGALNYVDDVKQGLSVRLTELLDDGCAGARSESLCGTCSSRRQAPFGVLRLATGNAGD